MPANYITILTNSSSIMLPGTIYKYRDWTNPLHRMILLNKSIWFSSPADFIDTSDCRLDYHIPTNSELLNFYEDKSKKEKLHVNRCERRQWAMEMVRQAPIRSAYNRQQILNLNQDFFNNCFGVFSASNNSTDSRMWTEYGKNNEGFCIALNLDILKNTLILAGGGAGQVNYQIPLPRIDIIRDTDDTKIIKKIYSKHTDYTFEDEYRLHKIGFNERNDPIRNLSIPANAITEVILGSNMPQTHKDEIRAICAIDYPNTIITERQ